MRIFTLALTELVGRCDFCGEVPVSISQEITEEGIPVEAFACRPCSDQGTLTVAVPLELIQWSRGIAEGPVEWREIDEAALTGTFSNNTLRARVGNVSLQRLIPNSGNAGDSANADSRSSHKPSSQEPSSYKPSLYAGTFHSPLEQKTVIFWSRVSLL